MNRWANVTLFLVICTSWGAGLALLLKWAAAGTPLGLFWLAMGLWLICAILGLAWWGEIRKS